MTVFICNHAGGNHLISIDIIRLLRVKGCKINFTFDVKNDDRNI